MRVIVSVEALESGEGHGFLEGSPDAVSIATIVRIACDTGTIGAMFLTDGTILDLGREQRLYSKRQRITLAAKWGGCAHPECDKAPIDCEAHHIDEWVRDNGRTDVDRGISLCRRHHKLLHDNNERVIREGNEYKLVKREPEPGQPGCPGSAASAATQHDGGSLESLGLEGGSLAGAGLNGGSLGNGATVPAKRILLRSKNPLITTMMRTAARKTSARKVEKASQRETAPSRT